MVPRPFPAHPQLCAALSQPGVALTSLDLNGNRFTDAGAQALADVLAAGKAPDLIELTVSGCPLTEKGKQALEAVGKERKALAVVFTAKDVVQPVAQHKPGGKGARALPPAQPRCRRCCVGETRSRRSAPGSNA